MKADADNLDPRVKKLIWIASIFAVLAIGVIALAAYQGGRVYQKSWKARAVARQMLELGLAGNDPEKEEKLLSAQTKLLEAEMFVLRKKYAEAHNAYEEATHSLSSVLPPNSPFLSEVYRHQGDVESYFKKWDQAERAFCNALRALRTDGSDEEEALSIQEQLVYVLRRAGKYKLALAFAQASSIRAEKAHLDLAPPLIELAKTEMDLNKYSQAEEHFTRAIALHPEEAEYYFNRGALYSRQDLHEKALADHLKALSIDPKDANMHNWCAEDYRYLGDHQKAVQEYARAIELAPEDSYAYGARAWVYHRLGRYEEELQDLNQELRLDPNDGSNYALRGDCHEKLGQHDSALRDYNAAIGLAGHKERIWDTVGGSKFDKSLKVYAYEKRAKVFDALGRPDQSAADIKIARRIEAVCRTIKTDENTKTK